MWATKHLVASTYKLHYNLGSNEQECTATRKLHSERSQDYKLGRDNPHQHATSGVEKWDGWEDLPRGSYGAVPPALDVLIWPCCSLSSSLNFKTGIFTYCFRRQLPWGSPGQPV